MASTALNRGAEGVRVGDVEEESRNMEARIWAPQLWPIR